MSEITIALDRDSSMTLQDQLRQQIVDAIYTGALPAGKKVPSSRVLASRLRVSRNTVMLVYDDLIADGLIESRSRSGLYVLHDSVDGRIIGLRPAGNEQSSLASRMAEVKADTGVRCPPQWRQYPWPFWDGCLDSSLLPISEWRKAVRLAAATRDIMEWSESNGELDDPMLLLELRTKVLPEQGISAHAEEVLVTRSMRQAIQFLARLLLRTETPTWLEEPTDPELLATLMESGIEVERFRPETTADDVPDGVVIITSARSGIAAGAPISPELVAAVGRRGGLIIEMAQPPDTDETGAIHPALYTGAEPEQVVHIGCLSPAASCGSPPAFIVADPSVITRLRRLRRVSGALPDLMQQRAWAWLLSLGHYAAALQRARRTLAARKTALRDALNHYLHTEVDIRSTPGVSAYWVSCRDERSARTLASRAAGAGILIRPARLPDARNEFLMGITGVPETHIREGVRTLAKVFRTSRLGRAEAPDARKLLSPSALKRAIGGKTLLYNTVYGEPCTIEVRHSGELIGMAGYANDDPDRGHWWIDDGRWFRQWNQWAYGEAEGFGVAIEDDRIYWYDQGGQLVDQAMILKRSRRRQVATT